MGNESEPTFPNQPPETEEPVDLNQPSESEIDRMQADFAAEQVQESNRRIDELLASTDRMLEMTRELEAKHKAAEASKPESVFEMPPDAKARLDEAQAEYDREWDIEDAKSIPQTPKQIRAKLAKRGIRPPKTAEEIEREGVEEISARAAHAGKVHEPRRKRSKKLMRPLGPAQLDIADGDKRVESNYGKPGE